MALPRSVGGDTPRALTVCPKYLMLWRQRLTLLGLWQYPIPIASWKVSWSVFRVVRKTSFLGTRGTEIAQGHDDDLQYSFSRSYSNSRFAIVPFSGANQRGRSTTGWPSVKIWWVTGWRAPAFGIESFVIMGNFRRICWNRVFWVIIDTVSPLLDRGSATFDNFGTESTGLLRLTSTS